MGIEWVKFYVDDILKATITKPPYNWTWDKQTVIFHYTLKVCACDFSENENWAKINVWKMQLFQL